MSTGRRLTVAYLTPGESTNRASDAADEVLGVSLYAAIDPAMRLDAPTAHIGARPLGGAPALCEVWHADGPLRSGRRGFVHHRGNGRYLFGSISLRESMGFDPAVEASGHGALATVTRTAYEGMFACLEDLGCPYLLRVWNYLPEINRETGGVERYRQFNGARQTAFRSARRETKGQVPAACALGIERGGPLSVYFLASTEPGLAIENPRQVAAYDYPPQYGDQSPVFARAMLADSGGVPLLFVSGTASIVGHQTLHAGDVAAQTRETAANLRALTEAANTRLGRAAFAAGDLKLKVYLRRPADLGRVAAEIAAALRPAAPVQYLKADICRADLLVEIEAVAIDERAGVH
jgi:enamine deaminase RidA (YjgF/YER057c/UK114 family)